MGFEGIEGLAGVTMTGSDVATATLLQNMDETESEIVNGKCSSGWCIGKRPVNEWWNLCLRSMAMISSPLDPSGSCRHPRTSKLSLVITSQIARGGRDREEDREREKGKRKEGEGGNERKEYQIE